MSRVRIDINAAWLHSHPDCKPWDDKLADLLEIIADDAEVYITNIDLNESIKSDLKTLKINTDTYLMWWKNIFIGILYKEYRLDDTDLIEFVCPKFWDDFIQLTKDADPLSWDIELLWMECEGDLKITVPVEYKNWLVEKGFDKETINDFYKANIYKGQS